ncbi:hypothetical protein BZA77DRAFT_378108 [Pyronema omphalodes]|nr:hypothetical protein BZA77DRAFT_378108 [Pyronema omphalodes]
MDYSILAYRIPAIGAEDSVVDTIPLKCSFSKTMAEWSLQFNPFFPPTKTKYTRYDFNAAETLRVFPDESGCSCGRARLLAIEEREKLKENQKPRLSFSIQAQPDIFRNCTLSCKARKVAAKVNKIWQTRAWSGFISVSYFLYAKPEPDEVQLPTDEKIEDELKEVPLIMRDISDDGKIEPTVWWKRELILVRVEDRIPVDVTSEHCTTGREFGTELKELEMYLKKNRGAAECNKDRFKFELPKTPKTSTQSLLAKTKKNDSPKKNDSSQHTDTSKTSDAKNEEPSTGCDKRKESCCSQDGGDGTETPDVNTPKKAKITDSALIEALKNFDIRGSVSKPVSPKDNSQGVEVNKEGGDDSLPGAD